MWLAFEKKDFVECYVQQNGATNSKKKDLASSAVDVISTYKVFAKFDHDIKIKNIIRRFSEMKTLERLSI